jgi:hypothetical protein
MPGENAWGKCPGKCPGKMPGENARENAWGKCLRKMPGENAWGKCLGKMPGENGENAKTVIRMTLPPSSGVIKTSFVIIYS